MQNLKLTEDELIEAKLLADPAYFAEAYLRSPSDPTKPLILRPYQRAILKDMSLKRILRLGRRTGKTVVIGIEAIWKAYTNADRQVLLVAGFDSQIQTIFDLIGRMVKDSPEVSLSIERTRMRPWEIRFSNGSIIMGFVGNNSVRGKCFPGNTRVIMWDLEAKQISEIKVGDFVKSIKQDDEGEPEMFYGKVTDIHKNGVQDIYELITTTDRKIRCTENHKLALAYKGWTPLNEIKTAELDGTGEFIGVVHPTGELYWARVKQVKRVGKSETYDMTVAPHHNFIAFNEVDENKSGYKVSGVHSGGFLVHNSAHDMYIDEVDSIPNDMLIEAVLPISTSFTDTTLTVSGTPSGRREFFYQVSKNAKSMSYSEHHYTSMLSPQWTSDMERDIKAVTTLSQFEREYLAEFGSPAEGVFKNNHIDSNLYVYNYSDLKYNPNNHYMLGVDWNESVHGVQAVVLEYLMDPELIVPFNAGMWEVASGGTIDPVTKSGVLRLYFADNIESAEYTNLGAVEFILKMMKKISFSYMAFDKGHGESNYEQLRLSLEKGKGPMGTKCTGLKHMIDKMTAVDMGGNTEIIDKVTGIASKSLTKNVMVKNAQLLNETGKYIIPAVDKTGAVMEDEETRLIGQMRGYIVDRIGKTGEVYASTVKGGLDHRLDAFLLATHGWMMNNSIFLKRESDVSAELVEEGLPLTTAIPGWRREMSDIRGPVPVYYQDGMPVFAHGNYLRGEPPDLDLETNERMSKASESKRSFRHLSRSKINDRRKGRRF